MHTVYNHFSKQHPLLYYPFQKRLQILWFIDAFFSVMQFNA